MDSNNSRIPVIDTIRGFALWGILIANIQTFALFAFLQPKQVYRLQLDEEQSYGSLQYVFHVLVDGQFYTIYSFLFGLGFYLLWQKNNASGLNADKAYKRRLWVLLIIGLIHGLIIWFGDILHKYAILGFTLVYFNKKSINIIIKWIIGLALVGLALQILLFLLMPAVDNSDAEIEEVVMNVLNTWQRGSFTEVLGLQKLGVAMLWIFGIKGGFAGMITIEIMFLLGLISGKMNLFSRITESGRKMVKIALWVFPISLTLKSMSCLDILGIQMLENYAGAAFISAIMNFIATPLLTICYLIGLTLMIDKSNLIILKWIGNAGRLGLTNYLMQSLICTLLFYGYSGALAGHLSLLQTFFCTIGIFSFQVFFSNIWLKFYKAGPIEQLWRRLSIIKQ